MPYKALYQQIEDLSAEITMLTDKNQFEQVADKLSLRLNLLKTLSEQVMTLDDGDEQERLRKFLLTCQQNDNQQVEALMHERIKLLADSQKQTRVKQAVNAYKQYSGSEQ